MSEEKNPRVALLGKMIGLSPEFWPYPVPKWLGLELLEIEEGALKGRVLVREEWLNPLGIMHGGIMATLMDEAMGMCSFSLNRPNGHASINMNVDFLYSANKGDYVYVEAEIIRKGKKIVHAESRLRNEKGELIAKSTSNLAVVGH